LGVRLPPDNTEAQIKAGTMLQATKRDDGSFDVHAALQEMGWDGKDGTVFACFGDFAWGTNSICGLSFFFFFTVFFRAAGRLFALATFFFG
jgi:hypothetical protein